jgi:NADH:ubiquinone oxidoreductase subunit E
MRKERGGNLMVTIQVCVGSSCFLRGAPDVIKAFETVIEKYAPRQVELKGTFCQELCTKGVTVRINEKVFPAVAPEDVPGLFKEQVIPILSSAGSEDTGGR